ncbi:hypothetical protein [Kribbella sp. CA-293567]|nr:hypothetical protein [Kribbella sp. CA-293567]WBQ05507.1 hypothetical protein OX958_01620 [Kribbella sp. CA-293567]
MAVPPPRFADDCLRAVSMNDCPLAVSMNQFVRRTSRWIVWVRS